MAFFGLLKFEIKLDVVISHINFISKDNDKCKCSLNFIQLVKSRNIFPLKVLQNTLRITGKLEFISIKPYPFIRPLSLPYLGIHPINLKEIYRTFQCRI